MGSLGEGLLMLFLLAAFGVSFAVFMLVGTLVATFLPVPIGAVYIVAFLLAVIATLILRAWAD